MDFMILIIYKFNVVRFVFKVCLKDEQIYKLFNVLFAKVFFGPEDERSFIITNVN